MKNFVLLFSLVFAFSSQAHTCPNPDSQHLYQINGLVYSNSAESTCSRYINEIIAPQYPDTANTQYSDWTSTIEPNADTSDICRVGVTISTRSGAPGNYVWTPVVYPSFTILYVIHQCLAQQCECTEDYSGGSCTSRTVSWTTDQQTKQSTGAIYQISDANNQGRQCGRIIEEKGCAVEGDIINRDQIGNPLSCATGQKSQIETDYRSSVGSLSFTRSYTKEPNRIDSGLNNILFGGIANENQNVQIVTNLFASSHNDVWTDNIPKLDQGTQGVKAVSSSGRSRKLFINNAPFTPQKGTLTESGDITIHRTVSGMEYHFNADGRLIKKIFRNGQYQDYTYPSSLQTVITDNFGRQLTIDYIDTQGSIFAPQRLAVSKVTDPAGNEYRYEYRSDGLLNKVIFPDETPADDSDNPFKTYSYADTGFNDFALNGMTDELGNLFSEWDYDGNNRAILSKHADGAEKVTVDYTDPTGESTQSTVRTYRDETNYHETVYEFKQLNGSLKPVQISEQPCTDCVVGQSTYQYDTNGYLSQMTDEEGTVTTYQYNTRGLLESKTEAVGTSDERSFSTTWHANYSLPLTVDTPKTLTTYQHDANGNVLSMSVMDKTTSETRTTAYTYNAVGQVLTVDGPRTDVNDITTFEYDVANGNLLKVINALGHETVFSNHDAHGKPLTITDPNNIVTALTYHPRGWLTSHAVDRYRTDYSYNAAGLITQIAFASGQTLTYEYDAAQRVTAIQDARGNRMEYTLDSMGNITHTDIKDHIGNIKATLSQAFNDLGRLKATMTGGEAANDLQYDAEGKLLQNSNALSHITDNNYDALDRLIKVVDPALGETDLSYDDEDNLTQVASPNGATTTYIYNGFNEVLSETSPDRGTKSYTYDLAGNLKTSTDAKLQTTSYTYDALNRVTRIDYADGQFERYYYDQGTYGKGHFTQVSDSSGTLRYYFNKRGDMYLTRQTTNGQVLDHRYSYNIRGLVSKMTYPSGLELTFGYSNNELRTIRVNGEIFMKGIQYFPFGDVRVWRWASDNSVYAKTFDQKGQVTRHPLPFASSTAKRTLVYDPIGRIIKYNDPAHPTFKDQDFTYDILGRLTTADASTWYDQTLDYDANGNRTSNAFSGSLIDPGSGSGTTQSVAYDYLLNSNVLDTLSGASAVTYQYDANGNTLYDGKHSLTYNSKNRFTNVVTDDNQFVDYLHNGLGQRVAKTTSTETTLYNYGESGELLGEYNEDGTAISETIYLFGQPVGVYRNNTLYRVYADHLGTPRVITTNPIDSVANPVEAVWQWNSDPFGELPVDSDPDGDGTAFVFNQRMPGQYYDLETGYFYNYFRTYDPSTGRYLQSDPIGLGGGLNTFGYVGGNPVASSDPYGLFEIRAHIRRGPTSDYYLYEFTFREPVSLTDSLLESILRRTPGVRAVIALDPKPHLDPEAVGPNFPADPSRELLNQCFELDTIYKQKFVDAYGDVNKLLTRDQAEDFIRNARKYRPDGLGEYPWDQFYTKAHKEDAFSLLDRAEALSNDHWWHTRLSPWIRENIFRRNPSQ